MKYDQVVTDLASVQIWRKALPAEEQADQKNVDKLVGHTEKILQIELTDWLLEMRDALAELYEETETTDETSESVQNGL